MELPLTFRQRFWIGQYASGLWLLPVCAYFALVPYGEPGLKGLPWFLVHSFNLLPHEAGHFFFRFFGELMMFAGGSILQLLFPCFFLSTALRYDSKWGAQISLVWLGQNWIDVSVYAGDAVMRSLPLIGGLGAESHDWYNILWRLDLLPYTDLIAGGMVVCAYLCWALMLAVPRWVG
ncbi:MAG: hypothetical protein AAF170_10005 [Bacteroidota bacterium]